MSKRFSWVGLILVSSVGLPVESCKYPNNGWHEYRSFRSMKSEQCLILRDSEWRKAPPIIGPITDIRSRILHRMSGCYDITVRHCSTV